MDNGDKKHLTKTKDHHTRIKTIPIMTKRCPYCSTVLALSENTCHSCKRKVGEPDKEGKAKIPGRWKGYVRAAIAITILGCWIYYGREILEWGKAFIG